MEFINGQALFNFLCLLSKCGVRGILLPTNCQVALTDHTGLYEWGLTLAEVWIHFPTYVSCNLPPEFLHVSVFRVVNPIWRYTCARKGTCRFLLSHRDLNQQRILGFLSSQCPKGTILYWILEGRQHILPLGSFRNGQPYLVYLTKDERRIKFEGEKNTRRGGWIVFSFSTFLLLMSQFRSRYQSTSEVVIRN